MQPVRSDLKMDAVTWKEMFLTFIFADDLAKSSVAGQYGFMPHWLDNFYFPTYRNMIFWHSFKVIRQLISWFGLTLHVKSHKQSMTQHWKAMERELTRLGLDQRLASIHWQQLAQAR